MKIELGINEIEKRLMEKERRMDLLLSRSREIIRECSNCIKAVHGGKIKEAKKHLSAAERLLATVRKYEGEFQTQMNHILQEYAEAKIILSAVENNRIPTFNEMGINEVPYLNGLLDAIGELKREMYEALRHNDRKKAELFFGLMESIYDEILPLRFSNAVLPDFRRKQDAARIQIEQARGELL